MLADLTATRQHLLADQPAVLTKLAKPLKTPPFESCQLELG
jgi:hypothetical protein